MIELLLCTVIRLYSIDFEKNWNPNYIVPLETLKPVFGRMLLGEKLNEGLLKKELEGLGFEGNPNLINNSLVLQKKFNRYLYKIGKPREKKVSSVVFLRV